MYLEQRPQPRLRLSRYPGRFWANHTLGRTTKTDVILVDQAGIEVTGPTASDEWFHRHLEVWAPTVRRDRTSGLSVGNSGERQGEDVADDQAGTLSLDFSHSLETL